MSVDEAAQHLDVLDTFTSMLSCPYQRGTGTCCTGCYSEPRCVTELPGLDEVADAIVGFVAAINEEHPHRDFAYLVWDKILHAKQKSVIYSKTDHQLEAHNDGLPCGYHDCAACYPVCDPQAGTHTTPHRRCYLR